MILNQWRRVTSFSGLGGGGVQQHFTDKLENCEFIGSVVNLPTAAFTC